MNRSSNSDCPVPRRGLGGIGLLVVVALALSTGLSGGEWARLAGSHRESAPTQARQSGAIVHAAQRAERRQTDKPLFTGLIRTLGGIWSAPQSAAQTLPDLRPASCRLRAELISLPPPARA